MINLTPFDRNRETCPRCFEEMKEKGLNALSRIDNETEICSDCGTIESLNDFERRIK
jgi:hypothetical protein